MDDSEFNAETINLVPLKDNKEENPNRLKFTEAMVFISAIGVIVFLALLAINPNKEAAEARNLKRSADVSTILSYVSSYVSAHSTIPDQIPGSKECVEYGNEICKSGPFDCTDLVNMGFLNKENSEELLVIPTDPMYIVIPTDPMYISINGTGYFISQDDDGLVTVCAPHAERNQKISFSKYMY